MVSSVRGLEKARALWRGIASIVTEVQALQQRLGDPSLNIAEQLCDNHPADHTAFVLVDPELNTSKLSFGELALESRKLATVLRDMGVERGSRVAVLMGKTRQLPIVLLALWRLGAVHIPLFTAFAGPAIETRVTSAAARLIVSDVDQHAKLEGISIPVLDTGAPFDTLIANALPLEASVAVGSDGTFVQLYTSGTTGAPKSVEVPGFAIAAFTAYMDYGLNVTADDVYWNAADPGWAYGLYSAIIGPLVTGWSAGALGTDVFDHWGQTEHGMAVVNPWDPRLQRPVKPGSIGPAMPGFTAGSLEGSMTLEVEESPLMWFRGYANAEEETAKRFTPDRKHYLTGDMCTHDGEDFFFASRADDVILAAGYRIGPNDIESIIAMDPAVTEVAVVGRPDAIRGEVVEAFVILDSAASRDGLLEHLQLAVRDQYGAHAYPRQVHVVSSQPKTPSGKVQRFVLRQLTDAELADLVAQAKKIEAAR